MLETYKKQNHLTNRELAMMMGVSQHTVWRMLHNINVGPKSIRCIAKLIGKEPLEVYEYYKR